MATRILFFASLREKLGSGIVDFPIPPQVGTVGELRAYLAQRGGEWSVLDGGANLRAAVNQRMAKSDTPVCEGDEIAFFPPVTGG